MATNHQLLERGRGIVQAMLDAWEGAGWKPNEPVWSERAEAWLVDSLLADADPLPVFTDPTPDKPSVVHWFQFAGGTIQVAVMLPQGEDVVGFDLQLANNPQGGEQTTSLNFRPAYQVVNHG